MGAVEKRVKTKWDLNEFVRNQLVLNRQSFITQWTDCGDYFSPTRPKFTTSDTNKGDRKNQKIIDSTGVEAASTLSAGMMSGITSPARPWFRLTAQDPEMADIGPVKDWLHKVTDRTTSVMLRSNLYKTLPNIYEDTGVFGTGCMLVEEDFETVLRTYDMPIGSYSISLDDKLKVNVFTRDFKLTLKQVVEKYAERDSKGNYDLSNFSESLKAMWENGNYETWVELTHTIRPNEDYRPNSPWSNHKKFLSVTYERGSFGGSGFSRSLGDEEKNKTLRERGYDLFPVLAPRWKTSGGDIYGTSCPGMQSIGDNKQVQHGEKRGMEAIDKKVRPPLKGPSSMMNSKISIIPGDISYVDDREGGQGLQPVFQVDFSIRDLEEKQRQIRERINKAFKVDLFLMLANSDRRQITATEVAERKEEKLLALGPVLERLNEDLLDPLIDLVFHFMEKQDLLPEPPEELQGMDLKVEYISIMAQAQKLVGRASLDQFTAFVGNLAAQMPDALHKIDIDKLIDTYGDVMSIPPGIIKTKEAVEQAKAQIAQAQQAEQQMAMMQQAAGAAKDLSQASMEGDNVLSMMAGGQ